MSASYYQRIATSPGAELLEKGLETPARRMGNAEQPTSGRELKQPPAVARTKKADQPPAAGTTQDGTPDRSAGGVLPIIKAQRWDCSGIRPDFYTANCPTCRSTIEVAVGSVAVCGGRANQEGCGTPFFTELAA